MSKPIHFEYQVLPKFTLVALDSKLSDYGFQLAMENNQPVYKKAERTIKDCRHIDGCVYLHLGRATDSEMVDLIEKFQKLKKEKGWKQNIGLAIPDADFKFD